MSVTPDLETEAYVRLRESLRVDLMRLGEDLVELPMLIMEAGEYCSIAISRQDQAANDLKERTAEAADKLRQSLTAEGTGKAASETRVTAALPKHKLVIAATRELEAAKLDRQLWAALVDAARAKQSALTKACDMTMAGYLAPSAAYNDRKKELHAGRAKLMIARER
jgi:hypothetical protein